MVIPCYNEARNLPHLLERLKVCVAAADYPIGFILVNNGSSDESKEILDAALRDPALSWLKQVEVKVNQGYGFGIWMGLQSATSDFVGWTHADLQTDPMDAVLGFQKLVESTDPQKTILCGRRINRPLFDVIFTRGMSLVASLALRTRLTDINAQPKIFHRSFLDKMTNPPYDFSLDLYLLWLAKKEKLKIVEQPVNFADRRYGEAKGGGSMRGKVKLTLRTWKYIFKLRRQLASS